MWVDNDTIGALVIPPERGSPPEKPPVPIGPNIQDNTSGKTSQVRQLKFYLISIVLYNCMRITCCFARNYLEKIGICCRRYRLLF